MVDRLASLARKLTDVLREIEDESKKPQPLTYKGQVPCSCGRTHPCYVSPDGRKVTDTGWY